jgi:divalent anion:Na+ symporter, DASS family
MQTTQPPPVSGSENSEQTAAPRKAFQLSAIKWAVVVGSALIIALIPVPAGVTPEAWRLLAIFVATIVGSIVRPVSGGAMVLLGITAVILTRAMPVNPALVAGGNIETLRIKSALAGYADPVVWLVLAAFMISRGMIKTGLGRRIALMFIRRIGHRTLGLGYALVGTDFILASVIPSNGARSGGIIFPITKSVAEAYDSKPGETARRLGAFLMTLIYQCEVIICSIFLTGQAGNLVIQKLAEQTAGADLSYPRWLLGGIVPGLVSLAVIPPLLYRLFPPEIKHTPKAAEFAEQELEKMGPMKWQEKVMLLVFALVAVLWTTTKLHGIDYAAVALVGICALLLAGVLDWEDVIGERAAWDVFIWYGGMVRMAEALGETGITKRFAEVAAGFTAGWEWWLALAALALIYFYAHYGFASITAHASAMYVPFLVVVIAAGAPPYLAALILAYFSNLSAGVTHYGTTPGPIYFGTGYVRQQKWWQLGLIASVPNILIWSVVGLVWWKILGWW